MVTRRLPRIALATAAFVCAAALGTYAGARASEAGPPGFVEGSPCDIGGLDLNGPYVGSPGDASSPEEAALRSEQEVGGSGYLRTAGGWSDGTLASLTLDNVVVTDRTANEATVWVKIDGQWAAKLGVVGSRGYWSVSNGIGCGPHHGFIRWLTSL